MNVLKSVKNNKRPRHSCVYKVSMKYILFKFSALKKKTLCETSEQKVTFLTQCASFSGPASSSCPTVPRTSCRCPADRTSARAHITSRLYTQTRVSRRRRTAARAALALSPTVWKATGAKKMRRLTRLHVELLLSLCNRKTTADFWEQLLSFWT